MDKLAKPLSQMTKKELTDLILKQGNQLAAAASRLDKESSRLDWLERELFDSHWGGTIGVSKTWRMAGPYRHTLQSFRGDTLREAIDTLLLADNADDSEHNKDSE